MERELAKLGEQSRILQNEEINNSSIKNEKNNFIVNGFNKFVDYSKSEEGKQDFKNVLDKIGSSLMAMKSGGQMVSGHFVPMNKSFGSSFMEVMQNDENKELVNKKLKDKEQQREQDIAYRNAMLERQNLADKNEFLLKQQNSAIKNKELNLMEEKFKASNLAKNTVADSLENNEDIKNDVEALRQAMYQASPYMGTSSIKSLQRGMGKLFKGKSEEAINNLNAVVNNFMARNIRKLPAYKQGILTDADFKNAVKGVFDVTANLDTNVKNVNSLLRSMGVRDDFLIKNVSKDDNNSDNTSQGWLKHE
jgi:hypothetical protein